MLTLEALNIEKKVLQDPGQVWAVQNYTALNGIYVFVEVAMAWSYNGSW